MAFLLGSFRRARATGPALLIAIPLLPLVFACGGDPSEDGSGGGTASGGDGPTSGGAPGSGGTVGSGGGTGGASSGGAATGGSGSGGAGTGGVPGALDLVRVETARKLKRRISLGYSDHAGCIVAEGSGIECRGADERDETFGQTVDLVAYSGLGWCVIFADNAVECDLATNVAADDVEFAESLAGATHLVKSGADGLLAVGVTGGVRAWNGDEELGDPEAPAGSVIGGTDSEVCTLAPGGGVTCFAYIPELTDSVDKAPFNFGTEQYVDLDQASMLLAAISTAGVLRVNRMLEDAPIEYSGLHVQVATDSDYWCMLSNVGNVACDSYPGSSVPSGIMNAPSGEFLVVDVSEDFACAVRPTGEVVCWGEDAPTFDSLVRLD